MKKYLVPARRLEVYDVVNNSGQDLGQVQDFMIDMTTGRVAYVVVAFGGILGLTDKWIAMPFEALCWSPDRRKFTVDLNPEVLKQAPGIDKHKWPDHYAESDTGWMNDLYNHYSCKPYWGNDTMEMAVVAQTPAPRIEPIMPVKTEMVAEKVVVMPIKTATPAPKQEAVIHHHTAGKFEVFKDKSDEFRFRLVAANGEIIAASQGYKSKEGAMDGIKSVVANAEDSTTEDLTLNKELAQV
jgi:uncharacterized protein YegP (UPF0339 family)/sporulation protein YlmC with PRC-barrel domain